MSHTPRSLISVYMLPSPTASLSTSNSFAPSLMLHRRRVLRRERYKHPSFVSTSPMHPRTHIHTPAALSHAPFVSHVPHTHLFPKPYTRIHAYTVFSSYTPPPPYSISRIRRAGYMDASACTSSSLAAITQATSPGASYPHPPASSIPCIRSLRVRCPRLLFTPCFIHTRATSLTIRPPTCK